MRVRVLSAASAAAYEADGTALMLRLQCGIIELLDQANDPQPHSALSKFGHNALVHQLLSTLELHCKLEQQLLSPQAEHVVPTAVTFLGSDEPALAGQTVAAVRSIRDVMHKVRTTVADRSAQTAWLLVLQGIAVLHFESLHAHLATVAHGATVLLTGGLASTASH